MKQMIFLFTLLTSLAFAQTNDKYAEFNQVTGADYKQNMVVNQNFEKNIGNVTASVTGLQTNDSTRLITGLFSYLSQGTTAGNTDKFLTLDFDTTGRKQFVNQNCSAGIDYSILADTNLNAFKAYVEDGSGNKISPDYELYATAGTSSLTPVKQTVEMNFICPSTTANVVVEKKFSDSVFISVDNLYAGLARNTGVSAVVGPEITYTPTFTGFGTVTVQTFTYQMTGPNLIIKGKFTVATSTSVEGRISLPTGFTMSSALPSGTSRIGFGNKDNATTTDFSGLTILGEPSVTYMTFGLETSTTQGLAKQNGNVLSSGRIVSFTAIVPIQAVTSNALTVANNLIPSSWSGYHANNCSWGRTNTAYGDPTGDATCTFTERLNNNFGTVASATDGTGPIPGIVWTPNKTGTAWICAFAKGQGGTAGNSYGAQLVDNSTTQISEAVVSSGTTNINGDMELTNCALTNISAVGSPLTYKLQTKATGGSVTLDSAGSVVEWRIMWVSGGIPAFLVELPKSFQVSTTAVVSSAVGGTAVTGCSTGATGIYTCTPTGYTTAINCSCTPTGVVSTNDNTCFWETMSITSLKYRTTNAGALANEAVSIICQGY